MIYKIVGLLVLGALIWVGWYLWPILGKRSFAPARWAKMQASPQFQDGAFVNAEYTPTFDSSFSAWGLMKEYIFPKSTAPKPPGAIPSKKENLDALPEGSWVWLGHSGYFFKLGGKTWLMDPVLSGHASPFSFGVPAFEGADAYTVADFPAIDYLILSHDHYDHLDFESVRGLFPKVKHVIAPLGVGEHLVYWGYSESQIQELDWHEGVDLAPNIRLTATPARHFSGRGWIRNNTLWASYVLQVDDFRIFLGGDSGYGKHFKEIGDLYGPFDLAIIECGQYHTYWRPIHIFPQDIPQAVHELQAQAIIPVHWGKFKLALHDWDESIETLFSSDPDFPIYTPLPGSSFSLISPRPTERWWRDLTKSHK